MAGSLLVPVSVTAKVVKNKTDVPSLDGKPFNKDVSLEAGVHVHWALPDALTRARIVKGHGPDRAVFPGVPDIWLVVRFNQAAAANAANQKRNWRAWVVDSVAKSVTALAQWTPPATRDLNLVHTVAGMLPSAASAGYKGWGSWDSSQPAFDIATAAYYPAARTRFGLYDDLADIPKTGKVSYTVVGWYAVQDYDPLHLSSHRSVQLREWRLTYPRDWMRELIAPIAASGSVAKASWKPSAQISFSEAGQAPVASAQSAKRMAVRNDAPEVRKQKLSRLQSASPQVTAAGVSQSLVESVTHSPIPAEIVCHGSVMAVSLAGAAAAADIPNSKVHLHPSVKRAAAAVAGVNADAQNRDFIEIMLQDLDHLKGSVAGIIDMPGAAHALSFQGAPGKSTYYAKIRVLQQTRSAPSKGFSVSAQPEHEGRAASGHWPQMQVRSATLNQSATDISSIPVASLHQQPQKPKGPTPDEIGKWIQKVRQAFNKAFQEAAQAGKPIDPRMLIVQDTRKKAQPLNVGTALSKSDGSSGAAWWIDINDDNAIAQILIAGGGAAMQLPDSKNLHEQPSARWYRPWSPQIVLFGTKRSYRFGFDGRFDEKDRLHCRVTGDTMYSLAVGDGPGVIASSLLANPANLNVAGLPPEAKPLLAESLLLDTESAGGLAAAAAAPAKRAMYETAVQALWLSRETELTSAQQQAIAKVGTKGKRPSPVAITPWQDPVDPLFLDANYSHARSTLENDWKLNEREVEMIAANPQAVNPPDAQVEVFDERSRVTPSIAKVLNSTLVTRQMLDATGHRVPTHMPPKGIDDEKTFVELDVLSAPLTAFDQMLKDRGFRQRTGALRVNNLNLVDVFGFTRKWNSGIANTKSSTGGPANPWWTPLTPRLPYWSRLQYRLLAGADPNVEASNLTPPVCGFLLPDFIEHALEVFDSSGKSVGQLKTTAPQFGSKAAKTLNVAFSLHPWVAAELNLGVGANPLDGIQNSVLRSVVAGIAAQPLGVPANQPESKWFESGLTGLLRVFDTVRGTLDPTRNSADKKVHLLGEPVVVLNTRLTFQTCASNDPSALRKDAAPMITPPALPTIAVRIGDVSRPDDGVIGCFIPGDTPANSRFAPVSKEAATNAVLSALQQALPKMFSDGVPVEHPFIKDQVSAFELSGNTQKDVIVLADVRGDIYVTCGALPRKKITIPREFIEPALKNLDPSFRVSPVFVSVENDTVRPYVPQPKIEGFDTLFVQDVAGFPSGVIPPVLPVAELPPSRARLSEGWARLKRTQT